MSSLSHSKRVNNYVNYLNNDYSDNTNIPARSTLSTLEQTMHVHNSQSTQSIITEKELSNNREGIIEQSMTFDFREHSSQRNRIIDAQAILFLTAVSCLYYTVYAKLCYTHTATTLLHVQRLRLAHSLDQDAVQQFHQTLTHPYMYS